MMQAQVADAFEQNQPLPNNYVSGCQTTMIYVSVRNTCTLRSSGQPCRRVRTQERAQLLLAHLAACKSVLQEWHGARRIRRMLLYGDQGGGGGGSSRRDSDRGYDHGEYGWGGGSRGDRFVRDTRKYEERSGWVERGSGRGSGSRHDDPWHGHRGNGGSGGGVNFTVETQGPARIGFSAGSSSTEQPDADREERERERLGFAMVVLYQSDLRPGQWRRCELHRGDTGARTYRLLGG